MIMDSSTIEKSQMIELSAALVVVVLDHNSE
jgi:hypothetical protein